MFVVLANTTGMLYALRVMASASKDFCFIAKKSNNSRNIRPGWPIPNKSIGGCGVSGYWGMPKSDGEKGQRIFAIT